MTRTQRFWRFAYHRKQAHDWRPVYGDEIMHVGWKRWVCKNCPATHDNPVSERPIE